MIPEIDQIINDLHALGQRIYSDESRLSLLESQIGKDKIMKENIIALMQQSMEDN